MVSYTIKYYKYPESISKIKNIVEIPSLRNVMSHGKDRKPMSSGVINSGSSNLRWKQDLENKV